MADNEVPEFLSPSSKSEPKTTNEASSPKASKSKEAGKAPSASPVPTTVTHTDQPKPEASYREGLEAGKRAAQSSSVLSWLALFCGMCVVGWQAYFGYKTFGLEANDSLHIIANMGAILLGLATFILGTVSLAQRRRPFWPAISGLSLGLAAFVIHLITWFASLK